MASETVQMIGGWRVSSTQSNFIAKAFSNLVTASTFVYQDVVLQPGVSEFLLSFAQLSMPQAIFMMATEQVRVNFAGQASSFSAASAGIVTFNGLYAAMNTSGAL